MNNYGYQNEIDFVMLFNDKYLCELDNNSQLFLKDLFNDYIDNEEKIICWKNKVYQKADIFIKYKNHVKSISIKCGNGNSIHAEPIQDFKMYLEEIGIPYKIIEKYVSYHYGYMRDQNGKSDYSKRLGAYEYLEYYQDEVDDFNNYINKTKIIIDMIDRFLIRGKKSNYDIDCLVSGTVNDYVWIMKYDLYDLVLSKRDSNYNTPHVACFTIGPKKRYVDINDSKSRERYIVVVRWNYIHDSIIEFKSRQVSHLCSKY